MAGNLSKRPTVDAKAGTDGIGIENITQEGDRFLFKMSDGSVRSVLSPDISALLQSAADAKVSENAAATSKNEASASAKVAKENKAASEAAKEAAERAAEEAAEEAAQSVYEKLKFVDETGTVDLGDYATKEYVDRSGASLTEYYDEPLTTVIPHAIRDEYFIINDDTWSEGSNPGDCIAKSECYGAAGVLNMTARNNMTLLIKCIYLQTSPEQYFGKYSATFKLSVNNNVIYEKNDILLAEGVNINTEEITVPVKKGDVVEAAYTTTSGNCTEDVSLFCTGIETQKEHTARELLDEGILNKIFTIRQNLLPPYEDWLYIYPPEGYENIFANHALYKGFCCFAQFTEPVTRTGDFASGEYGGTPPSRAYFLSCSVSGHIVKGTKPFGLLICTAYTPAGAHNDIAYSSWNFIELYPSPISKGDGENSLVSGTSVAIAENDISLGDNNVAGRKAYYIKAIDNKNKKIYLSNERTYPPVSLDDANLVDTTFETPAYDDGDEFSVRWGAYRHFVDTIATIKNNVVTWAGDTLFTAVSEDAEEDAYTFHVPSKPDVGIVELGINAFVVGGGNKGNGRGVLIGGEENTGSGDYGLIGGLKNKGGFGCIVGGNHNEITGNNSFGGGLFNWLKTTYSGILGLNNTVTCDTEESKGDHPVGLNFVFGRLNVVDALRTWIFGLRNKIKGTDHWVLGSDNELDGKGIRAIGDFLMDNPSSKDQVILGTYNMPDADARLIVGNGTDEDNRSNALVVKKTGETVLEKVYTQPEYAMTWGGDGATYGVTIPGITELKVGTTIRIILNRDSTQKTPSINVNNLGYKKIRRPLSLSTKYSAPGAIPSWLAANVPLELVYRDDYWVCNNSHRTHAEDIEGIEANQILVGQGYDKSPKTVSIDSLDLSKNTVITDLQSQINELKTMITNNF